MFIIFDFFLEGNQTHAMKIPCTTNNNNKTTPPMSYLKSRWVKSIYTLKCVIENLGTNKNESDCIKYVLCHDALTTVDNIFLNEQCHG